MDFGFCGMMHFSANCIAMIAAVFSAESLSKFLTPVMSLGKLRTVFATIQWATFDGVVGGAVGPSG